MSSAGLSVGEGEGETGSGSKIERAFRKVSKQTWRCKKM